MNREQVFKSFEEIKTKGIFARVPKELHAEVLLIKEISGKSIYSIVEASLELFVAEFKERNEKKAG